MYIKVNNPTINKDGGWYKLPDKDRDRYILPGVYKSVIRSSVLKVTT